MIKNDRQYRIINARVDRLSRLADDLKDRVDKEPTSSRTELELRAVTAEISRMREELMEYTALRSGEMEVGEATSLADIPRLLIRSRIAAGLTQAELAERLGLKEQQIQRYESNNYEAASLARLMKIADVLNVRLQKSFTSSDEPSMRRLLSRLETVGLDRKLISSRIAPSEVRAGRTDAASIISLAARLGRIFGWDVETMMNEMWQPSQPPAVVPAFKLPKRTNESHLRAYAAYAHYLALQALRSTPGSPKLEAPKPPSTIRREMQEIDGISFRSALTVAWNLGIRVLPLTDPGAFHAAYWRHDGQGVIVLKQRRRHQSLWLFDLLHEIYHALEVPKEKERQLIELEPEESVAVPTNGEARANQFAGKVLFGNDASRLTDLVWEKSGGRPARLKDTVRLVARKEGVDLGTLAYFVAHVAKDWGINWWSTANTLQSDADDPWAICRDEFLSRADLSGLDDLDRDLLLRALSDSADERAHEFFPES